MVLMHLEGQKKKSVNFFNQILGFFAYIMTQLSQEEIDYDTIDTDALDELIEDAGDLFADLDGPTTLDPTMVLPYSPLSQDGLSRFQMDLTMSLSQTLMSVDEDADDLFGDDDDDDSFMDFSNFFGSDVVSTDSDTGYVSFDLVTYLSQSSG